MSNHVTVRRIVNIGQVGGFNTVSSPPKRKCSDCGKPYYRVNTVMVWSGRNVGKRYGWHKEVAKVCTNCQDARESKELIGSVSISFNKIGKIGGGRLVVRR